MKDAAKQLLVLDTTALINFRGDGLFAMVRSVTGRHLVTTEYIVEMEVVHEETMRSVTGAIDEGVIEVADLRSAEELTLWETLSVRLARGEASALAYAACGDHAFLTDDQDCHAVAVDLIGQPRCLRSCRVLVDALDRTLLTPEQAHSLFKQWCDEEFRMPWASLDALWQEVFPGRDLPG